MVHPFHRRVEEVLHLHLDGAASSNRSGIEEDDVELVRWARPHPGLLPAGGTRRRNQAEASCATAHRPHHHHRAVAEGHQEEGQARQREDIIGGAP
jgi:hypothetical protein